MVVQIMKNNTSKIVWSIVVIVVILVGLVVWVSNSASNTGYQSPVATTSQATTSSSTVAVMTPEDTEVGLSPGEASVAYQDALKIYTNKRIQFNNALYANECQASPNALTFASGVKFMLDNRMDKTAAIHFSSGVSYSLPAYSFQIISLQTPATYNVDCGSSQNVVKVQIQK